MSASLLERWFGGRTQRDGASAVLEAPVTGFAPATLSAATEPAAPARSRRDRALGGASDVVLEVLAQKVLHAWLQNRHQTLFPLTVNLRAIPTNHAVVLAEMMAVAALAGGGTGNAAAARAWFTQAGADADALAAFDRALADPPALSRVLAAVAADRLAAYAYVAALVALDARDPASMHFLDFVAAKLALPTTVVRSANRRYRR